MTEQHQPPGRTLVFTGPGKGKTTAALGMVARARGHGQRCAVIQFVKSDPTVGEVGALQDLLGVTVEIFGRGFVPPPDSPAFVDHQKAAQAALTRATVLCQRGSFQVVVLDEVCVALAKGLIEENQVVELLALRHPGVTVVLTGRGAPASLLDRADTVTEMVCVKHGFEEGLPASPGVEF